MADCSVTSTDKMSGYELRTPALQKRQRGLVQALYKEIIL
jgi:hypothetical protein